MKFTSYLTHYIQTIIILLVIDIKSDNKIPSIFYFYLVLSHWHPVCIYSHGATAAFEVLVAVCGQWLLCGLAQASGS